MEVFNGGFRSAFSIVELKRSSSLRSRLSCGLRVTDSWLPKRNAGNSYYGLAIGCTLLVGAYAGGGISGGAYNPAVAVGISTMGLSPLGNIWFLLVGSFLGGALAAIVYKMVNPSEMI